MMTGTISDDNRQEGAGVGGQGAQSPETGLLAGYKACHHHDHDDQRSTGACDSFSSSSAGSASSASSGPLKPRKRRSQDRQITSPCPHAPYFNRRHRKQSPKRQKGRNARARKLQAQKCRREDLQDGQGQNEQTVNQPVAEDEEMHNSSTDQRDDAPPSPTAPMIAVPTYSPLATVDLVTEAIGAGNEDQSPDATTRPPVNEINDRQDASINKSQSSLIRETDDASDGSDDKDDPMDMDSGMMNSPTVSSHSLNIDSQTGDDLRRLAMENTDTLEQLATKINAAAPGAATDRARSLFVTTWLMANYEVEEEHNVPRSSMYSHYLKYCQRHGVRPVNSASFGKLIRSVFPDLKTRRLGTRGQSKYHYCGIRVRHIDCSTHVPPNKCVTAAGCTVAQICASPRIIRKRSACFNQSRLYDERQPSLAPPMPPLDQYQQEHGQPQHELFHEGHPNYGYPTLPEFPTFPEGGTPEGFRYLDVVSLLGVYQRHCQQLLDYVQTMRFAEVEGLITRFWLDLPQDQQPMFKSEHVVDYIYKADAILFDTIMGLLLPNVLQPMPLQVIQAIRTFARLLETWLLTALAGYPEILVAKKIEVGRVFSAQLRRHTSLNHLVQAAQSVFTSPEKLYAMMQDWANVDFESIRDQASWVCECHKTDVIQIMEVEFQQLLATGSRLENWTEWISGIVDRFLDESMETQSYLHTARQLLLKWSFYSSLAMRDLTLRSAPSFGSFHLVRLLYDEYIFYIVEQKIANKLKVALAKNGSYALSGATSSSQPACRPPPADMPSEVVDQTVLGSLERQGPSRPAEPLLPIHTAYPPMSEVQEISIGAYPSYGTASAGYYPGYDPTEYAKPAHSCGGSASVSPAPQTSALADTLSCPKVVPPPTLYPPPETEKPANAADETGEKSTPDAAAV